MTPQFAIQGDGTHWCWFSQPLQSFSNTESTQACWNQIQEASQHHPVTFAVDYETSIAHAYQQSADPDGIQAIAWESMERLTLEQVLQRLPAAATLWSWSLEMTPQQWTERIGLLQEYLKAGDCYQGNLTLRGRGRCDDSAASLFSALIQRQASPYAAFMPWQGGHALSLSPELLWRVEQGRMECQPMKGTVGLGASEQASGELAQWLASDTKNRAENLMILDLIRNDLGRIAQAGSVKVPSSFEVRRYETLQQMVSTVTAQLNETSLSTWCSALMPYGSITGAPKKRAIEILEQLEMSPRGLYTGSCGYVYQGQSVANVAIRTATLIDGALEFGVGGGITLDSEAMDEWREVLLKARFIQTP